MEKEELKSVMFSITKAQAEWLQQHRAKTGNYASKVVRVLLDYYITLEEDKEKLKENIDKGIEIVQEG